MSEFMNTKIQDITDASLELTGKTAESVELLRTAIHSIADRETARPVSTDWLVPARSRQRRAQHRMVLVWASAAALFLAILTPGHKPGDLPLQPPPPVSDALLEHVDSEISETVPDSLAPLTELDSWNSTSSNISTEKKNAIQ